MEESVLTYVLDRNDKDRTERRKEGEIDVWRGLEVLMPQEKQVYLFREVARL